MNVRHTANSMLAASALLASQAHADYTGYLSLQSATDATWDTSSAIWVPYGGGELQRYTSGSNVVIGPDFTGTTVTPGAWLQPGNVVFDSASDIVLGVAQNNNGFGGNTVGISKRGSGKLTVASGWNGNKCPWHVYAGILSSEDKSTSANTTPFGSFTDYEPTIYVHDGAVLEDPSSNTLGSKNDTAEAEDKCVNVVVYTNGVFRPGITGSYQYPYSAVRDLILDGGTLDTSKKGAWGSGALKVTRKLAFKGTSPYVLKENSQAWMLALASSRQTEIAVDDITGDADADVTFDSLMLGRASEAAVTGFRKTGAGTLVFKKAIEDGTAKDSMRGWVGVNGTITVDDGTLVLENASSTFTGDIEVAGTLRAGGSSISEPANLAQTALGSLMADRSIILDGPDASLPVLCRWPFGNRQAYTNEAVPATFVATNGATFVFGDASTTPRPVAVPNLWICDSAVAFNEGEYGTGVGMIAGTLKVTGSTPVTVAPVTGKSCQYLCVNPAAGMNEGSTLQTVFDVADVTGDAAADLTFTMPFGMPNFAMENAGTGTYMEGVEVGFRKTGDGTLSLAYNRYSFGQNGIGELNGTISVDGGTLDLRVEVPKATVAVSSGAAICGGLASVSGGNVYVKAVNFAAGGGIAATDGATDAVRATESVSFGANGFIDVTTASGIGKECSPTTVFKIGSSAAVSGVANLENWTLRVNGKPLRPSQTSIRVEADGSVVVAKRDEATLLVFH